MSKNGKSEAYKSDRAASKAAEIKYANNPFEVGSRPHKMFDKLRSHSDRMDVRFSEMEEVYGSFGTPRTRIDNEIPAGSGPTL